MWPVCQDGQEQIRKASWSQVGWRERLLFLGATHQGLMAGPRRSGVLSAPHGNPSHTLSCSRSFPRTIPRLCTSLCCGLCPPACCCSLLAGSRSCLPSRALPKNRKSRGLGRWEDRGEVNETENWKRCWRAFEGNQGEKHGDHSSGSSLLSSSTIIFLTG